MGTRGRGATRARRGSAKPKGGGVSKSGLRLRLRMGRDASQDQQEGTPPPVIYFNQDGEQEVEDKDDSSLNVGATRSGRVPKKRQEPDYAFGREMDHLWEISSAQKADDEDAYQPRLVASLTPSQARKYHQIPSSRYTQLVLTLRSSPHLGTEFHSPTRTTQVRPCPQVPTLHLHPHPHLRSRPPQLRPHPSNPYLPIPTPHLLHLHRR
jgi:hypothetical protein